MKQFSPKEEAFMREALNLANKGSWRVSPNPKVGAVLVKNGKIIGRGYHTEFGKDHAEIEALKDAWRKKNTVLGSVMYVTLEPCVHLNKKRPPCVPALIELGIKEVVIAMKDPNPEVAGKGIRALNKAGVRVRLGLLEQDAKALNPHFITWKLTGMPFVAIKVATSIDGKIATRTGASKWITSEQSRKLVHELRDSYDAILVGASTVQKDNPVLSGKNREPIRVILDSTLRTPISFNVLRDTRVIIATTNRAKQSRIQAFQKKGYTVKTFGKKITISPLLRFLAKQNISSVFVEGGSQIFSSFLDSHHVDFVHWFIAPKIIGGESSKNAIAGTGTSTLKKAPRIVNPRVVNIGPDVYISGLLA